MPIVAMPDGAQVQFPDDMPAEQIRGLILKKFPDAGKPAAKENKSSPWHAAVTDIPSEIGNAAGEAVNNITSVAGRGGQGPIEGFLNTGRAVMGVPQLLLSPITGAARSLIGHPLAEVENAGRRFSGMPADPEGAYTRGKGDADLASAALGSRGVPVRAPVAPPVPAPGQEVAAAAGRLSSLVGDVNVPRAIASDSTAVQRIGQGIRNVPIVGDAIPNATARLTDELGNAVGAVANEYGAGSGPNVASRIGRSLEGRAGAETRAATDAARASDDAVTGAWQATQDNTMRAIGQAETRSLEQARAAVGDMSPQDMGQTLIARLRAGEQEARSNKDRLYGIAERSDGAINAEAVPALRPRVAQSLTDAGREVDATLTPASSRMMQEIDRFSRGGNPDVTPGATYPRQMQEIEQTRKRLNSFSQAATNDADRAAAGMVKREFDNWLSDSFDNALFSGSDEALNAFRSARAANTEWRQRFGFNARDDADRIVNRIVTGEVTPQEVSNWLVGASQVGAKGSSSRMLTRIAEATQGDPEAIAAIRGGVWNRLSQATEGATAKAPEKVASGVYEFLNGSGRDVARRLFTPEQQNIMRVYADTLRRGQEARELTAEVAKNTKPSATEVGVGPMQELANAVLGRGGKTDEALFSAIDAYAKSGGKGDVQTLASIVRAIPAQDKADLAGAIIRNIGISPRTKQFSPDVFASQWATYTPQAKAILFGNAGPHRQALDDIMTISQRLKQVGSRFGNPSGTAQNTNLIAATAGAFAAPLTTLATAVGGSIAARILASPAGASSASKWAKSYEAIVRRPTAHTLAAYQTASSNLANTSQALGAKVTGLDFIRALQSPVPVRAEEEQPRIPGPPR